MATNVITEVVSSNQVGYVRMYRVSRRLPLLGSKNLIYHDESIIIILSINNSALDVIYR